MTRNQPNKYWTTYDQTNNNFQNLNTEDANVHWDGGGEFTVGYAHCCDCGFELTYWGVWDMNGSASVSSPTNNLGTPLDTTNGAAGLTLGGQVPDAFFTSDATTRWITSKSISPTIPGATATAAGT
jgi:hypothetical protein